MNKKESEVILSSQDLKQLYYQMANTSRGYVDNIKNALWALTKPLDSQISIIDVEKKIERALLEDNWDILPEVSINITNNKLAKTVLNALSLKNYSTLYSFLLNKNINLLELHLELLNNEYEVMPANMYDNNFVFLIMQEKAPFDFRKHKELFIKIGDAIVQEKNKYVNNEKLVWIKINCEQNIDKEKAISWFSTWINSHDILPDNSKLHVEDILSYINREKLGRTQYKKVNELFNDKNGLYNEEVDTTVFNINIEKLANKYNMPVTQLEYRVKRLNEIVERLLCDIPSFVNISAVKNKKQQSIYLSYEKGSFIVKDLMQNLIEQTLQVDTKIIVNEKTFFDTLNEYKKTFLMTMKLENDLKDAKKNLTKIKI